MTEPLSVQLDDVRKVIAKLRDTNSQMKQVHSSGTAQRDALGSPWGDDSTGDQFAKGPSGYLAQVDMVNSTINDYIQVLDSLSQSLETSINNFEQTDQQPDQVLAASPESAQQDAVAPSDRLPEMPRIAEMLLLPEMVFLRETAGMPAKLAQPGAAVGNLLASVVPTGGAAGLASGFGALVQIGEALAGPAAAVGNVLAGVVPTGGASGLASGFGALVQIVEALAQPAGEGVSAVMQAVQAGAPNGSGTPGGPAAPGQVPGDPAGPAAPAK